MKNFKQLETLSEYNGVYSGEFNSDGIELYVEADFERYCDEPVYTSTYRGEHCIDNGGYRNVLTNITKLESHFTDDVIELTPEVEKFLLSNLEISQDEY